MEVSGEDLFNQAKKLLVEEKDLDKAFYYFNLLLNHTFHDDRQEDNLLFHIASVLMKKNCNALSLFLFKEVIKKRENCSEAYNNIGFIYKNEQKNDEALYYFQKALDIANQYPQYINNKDKSDYLCNLGSMYIANGTPQKAIDYFDQAISLFSDNPFSRWNRSLSYLELGDYKHGFDEYDFGERQNRIINRTYGINDLPLWDGKPDKNKTVVLIGEQGIGDEILFASMLPDAIRDCRIIFDAHPRLADLFRLSFPDIPVYGTRKSDKVTWPLFHKIDARIGIGSLGKFYRHKESDFPKKPYLKADPKRIEKYRNKLASMSDKPKIGISWKGGAKDTGRQNRCIPLEKWKRIFELDLDFISLQYDKDISKEIEEFEKANGICLNHWQSTVDDYDETAALVTNLDLIISVPQSVVHLAGALGTSTFQLTPYKALWQSAPFGKDMPWYGCVKNFWQEKEGEWDSVMERVKETLCSL